MDTFPSHVYGTRTIPGLPFAPDGSGILFTWADPDSGFGATQFPAVLTEDPSSVFPAYVPEPEKLVYAHVRDATRWRIPFPEQYQAGGISLPNTFGRPPELEAQGAGLAEIPVVRGWPPYPGEVPMIGVALGSESEDTGEDGITGGFVGDSTLSDDQGNPLAWASYYSEPLYTTTVVELIHENRDERDRLHSELRRVLFPLRRLLPAQEPLVRRVQVDAEKQEIAQEDLPMTIYCSIFTVHVWAEMLVAGDVVVNGFVEAVTINQLAPQLIPIPSSSDIPESYDLT